MRIRLNPLLAPILSAIILASSAPALSSGGGGGGGAEMPSSSAPEYDPVIEYQKGIEAYQAKDFKRAVSAFRHVVSVVPTHAPAQYLLGASYIGQGDYKHAIKPLEAALKADPNLIDAQRDLALSYLQQGDAAKAAAQRDKLASRKAACAGSCPEAAQIDAALGTIDAAMAGAMPQALGPARTLQPLASVDASYVKAVSLINEGHYEPAIALLQASLWNAGPHPDLLTYLGYANRKLGKYDQAAAWYEEALAAAPNHRGALEYYGELKLERGDRKGALAHLARLEQLCAFGCRQVDELREQISEAGSSAS
jgi:tetratricopeptide (TPR) repeat protein